MPVPSTMADLFTLASSNSPAGTEAIGNSLDNYIRAGFSILRSTNALASATIAAASTTDLASADAESVHVTGTATITSLGTGFNGCRREVRCSSTPTFVHSVNLFLPGAANITVTAGEVLTFRCVGSGQWTLVARARNDVTGALGYTPVNKAGDTMTGALAVQQQFTTTGANAGVVFDDRGGATSFTLYSQAGIGRIFNTTLGSDVLTFNTSGNVTATGRLRSNAHFNSTTAAAVLSAEAGPIFIRPNGSDSVANQATFSTNGSLNLNNGFSILKVTVSSSAPGALSDGEIWFQY